MTPRYVFKNGKFDRIVWEKEEQAEVLQFQEETEAIIESKIESKENEKQAS